MSLSELNAHRQAPQMTKNQKAQIKEVHVTICIIFLVEWQLYVMNKPKFKM